MNAHSAPSLRSVAQGRLCSTRGGKHRITRRGICSGAERATEETLKLAQDKFFGRHEEVRKQLRGAFVPVSGRP